MDKKETPFLDSLQIQERIPHRYPFLLIDRVETFEHGPDPKGYKGRKIVATKNVTANEQFFQGHFPGNPVMPGVLQIEAMAQAGALACVPNEDEKVDVLFAKINGARFRKQVVPGDVLEIHAEIVNARKTLLTVSCKCFCFGKLASEVELIASVVPRSEPN